MIFRQSNHRNKLASQAAFTLAEVVIAVGVLGVSIISLYAGISSGFALTRVSRENLRATQIMMEKMEGIRLYNWNQLTTSNMIPKTFTTRYYPAVGGGQPSGVEYKGTITVTNAVFSSSVQPAYADRLQLISVEVEWESGGVTRHRKMSTLASKDGLQNYVFHR